VIYLLDVNTLIAAIWQDHEDQPRVEAWLQGRQTATCSISELGFLRISSGDTFPFRAEPEPCRVALSEFIRKHRSRFVPDDFPPRIIEAQSSRQFTDLYLAELAEKNRMKLATLDRRISHRAVVVIS
jgi:predicted nucleic acid-binding protein